MEFLGKKLNTRIERGDLQNSRYPDCAVCNSEARIVAYFEVKFHGAPFELPLNQTKRFCYEGSATLDYKKIEKQLEIIRKEISVPVYYLHWIEYPCLKGVFYETANQVSDYISSRKVEFERERRTGDDLKAKENVYTKKMYSPLLDMGPFDEFINEIKSLL